MKLLRIVIDDENRYFSAGLQGYLEKYAKRYNKAVRFLVPGSAERPDLLLVSAARRTRHWSTYAGARMLVIKARRSIFANENAEVLYRIDDSRRLFELLNKVLAEEDRPICRFQGQSLTPRERQVASHMRRGMGQSQTAKALGISVKTVHSHKRSIMGKLMINRNHEFIHWLLSQKEGFS